MNQLLSKIFTCLIAFFAFLSIAIPQEAVADSSIVAKEQVAQDSVMRSLLWKVSGNGLDKPSYVFGTIHLIPSEDYFVPDGMEEAILSSESVVFEIDIAELTDLESQLSIMMKAFMQDGTSLQDLLNEEDYVLVKEHFESMGIPFFLFDRLKPMFLSSFIAEDLGPDALNSGEMKSYEMEIYAIAEENSLETAGLETVEFQLSIFDSIPYKDQANMLVESIRSIESGDSSYQELIEIYKQQDIEVLYRSIAAESPELGDYGNLLISDRNKHWISTMKEIMQSGPAFFAVGAGHLGGKEGVIQLLRKEGYSVEPVVPSVTNQGVKRI